MPDRFLFAIPIVVLCPGLAMAADGPKINEIQVIGTHNSYHIAPHPNVLAIVAATGLERARSLDYTHRPLAEQFGELGIRQIELDVFADPEGGHYAEPAARKILKGRNLDPGPDPDEGGKLRKPGFKVFHVQDVDYRTTAPTLIDALTQIREWSDAHPRHVPIFVLLELKDEAIPALPTRPKPFDKAALDALDDEIRKVFDRHRILAPDDLRGSSETLPDAIRDRGWPTVEESRGKVMFGLDNEGSIRDRYLDGHLALRGRLLFASVEPTHPAAAWMKVNDPVADFDRIQKLVRSGFLVRTRADADTVDARKDDVTRREKALASGAQFVSTDYPEARVEFSRYRVRLPGDVAARPNPVSGDGAKAGKDAEGSNKN